jgi:excisionase family DNA binding protein
MSEKELLTAEEAAERLRITNRTLLRWAREGRIESVRVSKKKILFTEEAIERFIQERTRGIESGPVKKDRGAAGKQNRPRPKEGGGKGSSGEMWKGLRKEVHTWV